MEQKDLFRELGQIRSLMEKSSKFVSISGLSGVLMGCYALVGTLLAYYVIKQPESVTAFVGENSNRPMLFLAIALVILLSSLITGWLMARKKARKNKQSIWNITSKSLLFAVSIPLLTGGILSLLFFAQGYYHLIAAMLLIFYGLALTAGSIYTFAEAKGLGILEIGLGLIALCFPDKGLLIWGLGFGVLHIIYGFIVYKKYES
ncbi:MAG: hypothetical protein LBV59_22190 [Sphingobacterium sp.]|jgi:hypothetical protein|uniref:hypothetical protein n=1 Tax=Sphingobacterium sp. TaxID=341027 RepID=UPI002845A425|nr:hypothetical protein [Sphingobacterium sp.]MDR3010652.1 hypothetical protein [Sphingobacterium sp.]